MQSRTAIATILVLAAVAMGAPAAAGERPKAKAQTGEASFYHPSLAGKTTASGKPLAPDKMTAASPTLPLGSTAKVTNTETGQSAKVTITDRGPYAKGRILDVTPKAANALGISKKDGVADVKVQPMKAPGAKQ